MFCQASSSDAAAKNPDLFLPFEENGSLPDHVKNLKIGDSDLPDPVIKGKFVPLGTSPASTNSHGEFTSWQLPYCPLSCITC